ncbi:MAG: hypothetical protein AMXMBFR61_07220 [Fimbriimonadales bacterium]
MDGYSSDADNAYLLRVRMLTEAVRAQGHEVSMLHLLDRGTMKPAVCRALLGSRFQAELQAADVIHAANCIAGAAALRGTAQRTPVLYDVHGDAAAEARLEWSTKRSTYSASAMLTMPYLDRVARRGAKALLVVSQPSKDLYLRLGLPEERLFLVRNGVDLDLFSPSEVPADGPEGERWVGYAGGTHCWQGLPHLLKEFSSLRDSPLRLRVIGFGAGDAPLKQEFQHKLGDRAELWDAMPRERMIELLRECHALVIPRLPHPAVRVAMPTKFGEYSALGRPVLVNDVDETADLVRQHRSGLVSDWRPGGLKATLEAVAKLPTSELQEMGLRARALAEQKFAWPVLRAEYLKAVEYCLRS